MTATRRRAGLAAAIALGVVGISTPAWAGAKGQATSGSQSVTSASWGAVGTTTNGPGTTGSPFTLTWNGIATTQYFQINNTGSLDLSGETYTATNSALNVTGGTAPTVTLVGCVGAVWNSTNNKCTGTQVTLETTAAGSTTTTTAITTASSLSVRASTTPAPTGWTTAVTVSTVRAEVRAATTTNS